MISVVIPLYNKEHSINKTIQSVLKQTFQNFEIIVVNDGSTDKSIQVIKNITDSRVRIINKINGGVSSARNVGIKEAKYQWIAFLDGDDWWAPNFLSTLLELKDNYSKTGIWASQYVQVNNNNQIIKLKRFPKIEEGYFELYNYILAVCSSSILVKKDVFVQCGFFDENLTHGEDTDMWVRIGMEYSACYTSKTTAYYNIADNPLTKSTGKIPRLEQHFLSKIDQYIGASREWDKLLIYRKACYLKQFLIQYPRNSQIRKLIETLPSKITENSEFKLLKSRESKIFLMYCLLIIQQKIKKMANYLHLKLCMYL